MNSEEYLKRAYRSIYLNDFEQALQWFEKALAVEPDHADIHYRYSITCARSNRLEQAITHARLACALAPAKEEYKIHYDRLQAKELTIMARRLIEQHSQHAHEGSDTSTLLSGIKLLRRSAVLDPMSVETQVWLALAYIESRKYKQALHALNEASLLPHDDSTAQQLMELKQRISKYLD